MGVRPTEKVSQFLEKSNNCIHWQTEQNISVTWDNWKIWMKKIYRKGFGRNESESLKRFVLKKFGMN